MIKKSLMIGSLVAVFLISGCDSSSVLDKIPDVPEANTAYIVVNHFSEKMCTYKIFQDEIQKQVDAMDDVVSLSISSESGYVNCATYGRTNSDADLCRELDAKMNTVETCIITAEIDRDAIDKGKYQDFIDVVLDKYL